MIMKPLSFKINSDHFLLCVFLSLLWGVAETKTTDTMPTSTGTSTPEAEPTTTPSTTPSTTLPTTQPPPLNAKDFKSVDQNETSITLQWKNVGDFYNYTLEFSGGQINIAGSEADLITRIVPDLIHTTQYNFTLFTVRGTASSVGVNTTAYTAPPNAEGFKSVDQNETSITLQWKNVDKVSNYRLVFNETEIDVPASEGEQNSTYTVLNLTSGTKYDFTLYSLFENVQSSGEKLSAVTAPPNAEGFQKADQSETSITLQWKKVDKVSNYRLVFNETEIDVPASEVDPVKHTILNLTTTTQYNFTLFSVYENVRSDGVNTTAYTAPPEAEGFQKADQSETSITLQWKKVDKVSNYRLVFNGKEINVPASEVDPVEHTIPGLTNTTQYDFTLFSVYENVRSTGVNTTAYTAPPNAEGFKSVDQNETSITLQWKKVDKVSNYRLLLNEKEIDVIASEGEQNPTYRVPNLTSGTKFNFTLYSLFENVQSSGEKLSAVTAPRNTEELKSINQSETSITLQWKKVDKVSNYRLVFNETEINVTASEGEQNITYTVLNLTSGTKFNFTLYSLFENVQSSGEKLSAVTAPRNTEELKSINQSETSITLQWKKVDDILSYRLMFNETEIDVSASEGEQNPTYTVLNLTSGTKYDFTLYSLFENVQSSGEKLSAVTASRNVNNVTVLRQNESSITLMWDKVNNISTYVLQYDYNGSSIEVTCDTFYHNATVTRVVSLLNAGTKYRFTLITVFEKVNSTGFSFNAATVPSMVASVDVSERSLTSITLTWPDVREDWDYRLQLNGENVDPPPERTTGVVSYAIKSLQPGTEYRFNVATLFSGLESAAYEDFTVTRIDCSSATWRVTTSSIHGIIEGLFSNAKTTNGSQPLDGHVEGGNVSFTGLYPGATYNVSLVYEKESQSFSQCIHDLTIMPPALTAKCEYSGAGYAVFIVWKEREPGMWTSVELNVSDQSTEIKGDQTEKRHETIIGFLPARTYQVSLVAVSGTVKNSEPFVFSCLTDPRGVIAGSVCAVLLFLLLVLAVFIVIKKRPDIFSQKKSFISGSRQSKTKCKPISESKFPAHFHQLGADENRGFTEEYESLVSVGTEQTRKAATLPENKARNRFNNVLPYDWCRVKLATSNPDGTSDYINASYMPGYNSSREYIATQGPLPTTVNDFWTMIWEQKIKGIVMVTNCNEGGRVKCERYWPADKPCSYGELVVTLRSEQQEPDWTLREFRVKHRNNSEERTVKHFHFTAWPDHGVPQGTQVLIQFRSLVRRHINAEGGGAPTVVHCSAGVGRTGTIISLDVLLQQLEKERTVGIKGFVHKMRLSRPYMVQTESQYVFLHQCIMDCLQQKENVEENIYENAEMIYENATALRELRNTNV
ncbi:receptor-type tyrosine-protein phosphatase H-like [Centropristis striata]|uniref:receptor-type tyrosine-protein phosphatase H-like n=1 Tax=Centropristis striata TaxID=184440 RepID=UPI0027E1F14B|nr:receptor-type tyrosine-protein phosphatase H-like [Centropristis striata]